MSMKLQEVKTTTIPGYNVYEYLLVLSAHEELWSRIMKVKEDFADVYKTDLAKWGKPYVTLVNFLQYGLMEERIVNRLKMIAMGYPHHIYKCNQQAAHTKFGKRSTDRNTAVDEVE
jgi:hypothetical protein